MSDERTRIREDAEAIVALVNDPEYGNYSLMVALRERIQSLAVLLDPEPEEPAGRKRERVLCAAILYTDEVGGPHIVAGHRHNDIIIARHALYGLSTPQSFEQGFLTESGKFVNRYVAHRMAWKAGQTTKRPTFGSELFSEDLY